MNPSSLILLGFFVTVGVNEAVLIAPDTNHSSVGFAIFVFLIPSGPVGMAAVRP